MGEGDVSIAHLGGTIRLSVLGLQGQIREDFDEDYDALNLAHFLLVEF
jgi:hypothetical protein